MSTTVSDRLPGAPVRNVKVEDSARRNLTAEPEPRRNLTPRGLLIDLARKAARLEVKQMAADMGVSESFLLRGFKDQEHISWQRLQKLSAAFHRELILLQAAEIAGIEVRTTIEITRSA